MLVMDVAFCHDEIGNHNYLSIPECVEDMGAGIAKLFYDNSKSVIENSVLFLNLKLRHIWKVFCVICIVP